MKEKNNIESKQPVRLAPTNIVTYIQNKLNNTAISIREHLVTVSAETLGWIAVILIHLSTIPTLIAILTGLTEKTPPVDLVLATWAGLFLLFINAAISKDLLNIVTIGLGFAIQ